MEKFFILFILLIFPGLIGIIRGLLQNVYLWQVKEYRFDRFLSHLRFEKDYSQVGMLLWIAKIALLIVGSLYIIYPESGYLSFTFVIIYILYFLHLEWFMLELVRKRLVRPRLKSPRNLIIITLVLANVFMFYGKILLWLMQFDYTNIDLSSPIGSITGVLDIFDTSTSTDDGPAAIPLLNLVAAVSLLGTIAVDLLTPVWVGILVFITSPLARLSRLRTINKAKKIVGRRGENLRVIGITGSYGKTTTKELIYYVLSKKYKTARTIDNRNTAVGIAQSIIKQVKSDTEIFIAEMGSYKIGEIKEATKVLPPDIALVTALTQQHLSLFGSKTNLFSAKYELIEGLKEDGTAIFNGNDEYCMKMAMKTDRKKIFYYQLLNSQDNINDADLNQVPTRRDQKVQNGNENLYLNRVVDIGDFLDIDVTYQNKKYSFKAPLKESMFALNLMAAMTVCLQIGMQIDEIISIVEDMPVKSDYLSISKSVNDSQIIHDGKTSNTAGFRLALSFLNKKAQGKKWVLTQGILDLGSERKREYKALAKEICEKSDGLITNDRDLVDAVKSQNLDFEVVSVKNLYSLPSIFKIYVQSGDTVLVEGAFPGSIINQLVINEN